MIVSSAQPTICNYCVNIQYTLIGQSVILSKQSAGIDSVLPTHKVWCATGVFQSSIISLHM